MIINHIMDLSIDLVPEILKFVNNPSHLASACQVNRIFHIYASPLLYEKIAIYSWMKDGKKRFISLFTTLSCCPNLASFVRSLEIFDCPKFFSDSILSEVLNGLQNCINLRSCAWTRDGTITSQILEMLSSRPTIHELKINGHSDRRYDPHLLMRFKNLAKVSIIMPSSGVVNHLEDWVISNQHSLRSLSLICKESTLITDNLLNSLAPLLPNLEHLHITGCPRVTHRSVLALLLSNSEGLLSLSLEGLSLDIYVLHLAINLELTQEGKLHPLRRLQSISFSVPPLCFPMETASVSLENFTPHFLTVSIPPLLSQSPLEKLHIYPESFYPGMEHGFSRESETIWERVILNHHKTLRRVSIHQILISFEVLQLICASCTNLEELFVVVAPTVKFLSHRRKLMSSLCLSKTLQTIHINYPPSIATADGTVLPSDTNLILNPTEILDILMYCSFTITQFGCCSEVWKVVRMFVPSKYGYDVKLKKCEDPVPDVPEQFLVML